SCPGIDRVVPKGQDVGPYDSYAPLMSLPGQFGTALESIPAKVPYLFPSAEEIARRHGEFRAEHKLRVGIAWQGRKTHRQDHERSIPLAGFAALAGIEGVGFYSLQWGPGREQLPEVANRLPIVEFAGGPGDFHDTAALMHNLDLVIAC